MSIARVLVSIGLAGYAIAVVGGGLDRVSRRSPAVESAVPWPFRAEADRAAASTALLRKQNAAALAHARAAVSSDPVDINATALLGSALLAGGRDDDAAKAFRVAATFGWRNVATQDYWYAAALQAGDLHVAADRADAILRTHPRLVDEEQLLEPLESQPAGRAILAEHLAQQPPWMKSYLALAPNSSPELLETRFQVVSELGAGKVSLGCEAAAPFAASLIRSDRWNDAKDFWNANCPQSRVSGLVGDPEFVSVDRGVAPEPPFSWHVQRSGDVLLQHDRSARGALLATNSASATRLIVYQPVAFAPGIYRLRVLPGRAASAPGALTASLGCDGKLPYPSGVDGDLLAYGQTLRVGPCARQNLALWLNGNGTAVRLQSLEIRKIDPAP
jgi:hypothetical protein